MKTVNLFFLNIVVLICLFSCKDKDPVIPQEPNDGELITTVKLMMVNASNINDSITAIFRDLDGDGGNGPTVFDTIALYSYTGYNVTIFLLNESVNPADTISNEVEEEAEEHQFFYTLTGGAALSHSYNDADANGVPIGLKLTFTTAAGTTDNNSKIKVTLKHQPGVKPATGQGDITLGTNDIEVNFPFKIIDI